MNFIKAWQSLPDYGVSLFVVRFHGEKREELLGVAFNRIMRMSLQNGDHIKTWRFNTIKVCIDQTQHGNYCSNSLNEDYNALYVHLSSFRLGILTGKQNT